ncbi:uncharacterized protein LOC143055213 [Mytilus galloprovincialis]|uniref:uncharacterized protein LOC143055213 n=1 Tax=Mytilus galloprovincialis TaxID=29158 RepID=UPI003F7BE5A0
MIFLLILIIGMATGYDLKCPAKAEWRLKANVSCYSVDKYTCLLNLLKKTYMETCSGSDQSSIGSKLVFQPLFNLAVCDAGRYQPIVFTTDGNSECIYSKSKCADEGQLVFSNAYSSRDVTCRCDYTKGYTFVTKPKNSCFCKPSEEDCSCFVVTCSKLSPDYQCITDKEMVVNATCKEILPLISYDTDSDTAQFIGSNIKSHSNSRRVADIIIASIAVYFVLAVIVLFKFVVFVPPDILSQEIVESERGTFEPKCYVKSYLPLTSVTWCKEPGELISTDIKSENVFSRNGIRTLTCAIIEKDELASYKCIASNIIGTVESDPVHINDDERQKIIHKLFKKGERGKLHFARLVFIGKNGVGKTSLMRRLLWHDKEEVPLIQSTDGIEVEKCNINIVDGKWSPCHETDDDVRRLIRQVFQERMLNVERKSTETVDDQEPFSSNEDESRRVLKKELSTSFDGSHVIDIFNDDSKSKCDDSVDTVNIQTLIPADKKDDYATVETELNELHPNNYKSEEMFDSKINNDTKENEFDLVNDENINEMTSTILKSYLHFKEKENDDMLAFCWLWDFAGQKDFYATHQVFLSKHAVFLLVTDSLEFSTAEDQGIDFEGSAQYVSFWFDAIHCYWSTTKQGRLDPPIIVVCTNEDKLKEPSEREKRQKQFKENLRKILNNQEKKGHLRNIYFISNTEDTDIVFEEIRKDISRQAMDMEDWGKDCPLKWLLFQQVLLKLKDNNVPISSTNALLKIAKHKDIDISEDNEVKQCLQYCHDMGTVVYFDEENLADHVILDPKWLIKALRCLVSDKIDNVIEVSDDWETLTDTGQLTDSLISLLFKKEPELKFEENKAHLIEVMKRFDIIVNLKESTALYMPCMIKSCSFSKVQKQFGEESQPFYKTSWLCLEFKFLPPAFFNHVIAWYIKQYHVSVLIDKQIRRKRNALYRQVGVFDLDSSGCEQLVVCEGPNTIAVQVWDSRMSNKTYRKLRSELHRFVETLRKRYSLHIPYSNTFTCKDGDFAINRNTFEDLLTTDYRCLEHNINHLSNDLVKSWGFNRQLERQRLIRENEK